jgi:hypothetical protein
MNKCGKAKEYLSQVNSNLEQSNLKVVLASEPS